MLVRVAREQDKQIKQLIQPKTVWPAKKKLKNWGYYIWECDDFAKYKNTFLLYQFHSLGSDVFAAPR